MESERSASELTPHWQAFCDDKPEMHEFLEALAEAIHVRGEDCAPLSSLDDTGIEAAEAEGFIENVYMLRGLKTAYATRFSASLGAYIHP